MASRSQSPHKRSSLAAQFEGLHISQIAYKTINLPTALKKTFRVNFPSRAKLTLKMDPMYDYNRFTPDPEEVFQESIGYLEEIQAVVSSLQEKDLPYEDHLVESMVMMIFTSNSLENAGSSHPITFGICKPIFAGEEVPEQFEEWDPQYQAALDYLISQKISPHESALARSRRQVIQHALALKYLTYHMVIKREDLTEEAFKETHRILTDGIDADNKEKDKSADYGGIYRVTSVGWTFTAFANPDDIPKRMADTIEAFNKTIKQAEVEKSFDPFAVASKYFYTFLNIHPFLDGNSRLCRLLMNVIILKYTGIMIPIGRDSVEAAKWKETVTRASEQELADDDTRGGKSAWAEVTTLIAIQGRSTLRSLKERVTAHKKGEVYKRRKSIAGYHWEIPEGKEGVETWSEV
jgi:Fic family protein